MALLFQPLTIRNLTLKNRMAVSPMCQYSSINGFANEWHLVHLGSRAIGGAGLIFTEAAAISPEGRITPDDLGIWQDEHIDFLKRITTFIHDNNSVAGIQLAHAGRKASHTSPWKGGEVLEKGKNGWQTIAPSAIPFKGMDPIPAPASQSEIKKIIDDFQKASIRAIKADFKVIEIHAAHGYLLHEFLSPLSNQRTDEYGGSFDNRIRLLLEIVKAVRDVWTEERPLFVRLSAIEWMEGGWSIKDSVRLSEILKSKEVDLIDCSSGGNFHEAKIQTGPLYQVPFAEQIKKEAGILTGAVGMITTASEAEQILKDKQADIIFLARQFLRDPYFPFHAAKELGVHIQWPVQYERAKRG